MVSAVNNSNIQVQIIDCIAINICIRNNNTKCDIVILLENYEITLVSKAVPSLCITSMLFSSNNFLTNADSINEEKNVG